MSETGSLIPSDVAGDVVALCDTVDQSANEIAEAVSQGNHVLVAVTKAAGMQALRRAFTPALVAQIRPLMNTRLGFDTDRNPKKYKGKGGPPEYDDDTIRDVLLEGAIEGARFAGNEINILAGGLYLTKNYWERVFAELPDIESIAPPSLGFPKEVTIRGKTYAEVNAELHYRVDGRQCQTICTGKSAIRVVWNSGMSIEAVHGKVRKRLFKLAHEQVTGCVVEESGDKDVIDGEIVSASVEPAEKSQGTGGASGTQSAEKASTGDSAMGDLEHLTVSIIEKIRNVRDVSRIGGLQKRWQQEADKLDVSEDEREKAWISVQEAAEQKANE